MGPVRLEKAGFQDLILLPLVYAHDEASRMYRLSHTEMIAISYYCPGTPSLASLWEGLRWRRFIYFR